MFGAESVDDDDDVGSISDDEDMDDDSSSLESLDLCGQNEPVPRELTLNLANLQCFSIVGVTDLKVDTLNRILSNLNSLRYLDLSGQAFSNLRFMNLLPTLGRSLSHLVMRDYDSDALESNLGFICALAGTLTHLDLSNSREKPSGDTSPQPNGVNCYFLAEIVFHLERIAWLDVSGNAGFAGPGFYEHNSEIDRIKERLSASFQSNIKRLEVLMHGCDGARVFIDGDSEPYRFEDVVRMLDEYKRRLGKLNAFQLVHPKAVLIPLLLLNVRRLDFFGFLACEDKLATSSGKYRAKKLAKICGELTSLHGESFMINALKIYVDRPVFVFDILNHLYECYRGDQFDNRGNKIVAGLRIIEAMRRNLADSRIQISGSASLFYVLKYSKENSLPLTNAYLRRLIDTMIIAMQEHIDENSVSVLLNFY